MVKRLLALPARLYGAGGGWLLGHRFLLLTHRGRRTGRLYETVVEVIRWRPDSSEAVVMRAWEPPYDRPSDGATAR
jgi:hypothetical protein